MAAVTETTSNVTEFAGKFKVAVVEVDGAVSTVDLTLTIDEMDTIVGAVAQLKEAPTADCAAVRVEVDSSTANQINCQLYEDDHATVCTQNATDFYVIAIGY